MFIKGGFRGGADRARARLSSAIFEIFYKKNIQDASIWSTTAFFGHPFADLCILPPPPPPFKISASPQAVYLVYYAGLNFLLTKVNRKSAELNS